ncbi:hypothetical protein BE20_18130 [Sorangium cellulosum]|nr:hypothetical protein BE20_18130 [Sorangium cellulosum]
MDPAQHDRGVPGSVLDGIERIHPVCGSAAPIDVHNDVPGPLFFRRVSGRLVDANHDVGVSLNVSSIITYTSCHSL